MSSSTLTETEKAECLKLKTLIQERGALGGAKTTQGQLAQLMGVTQGSVSSFLNGATRITLRFARIVMQVYGIHPREYSSRLDEQVQDTAIFFREESATIPAQIKSSWVFLDDQLSKLRDVPIGEVEAALKEIERQRRVMNIHLGLDGRA